MKRSAAILGRTPQFVRWAIEYQCPLREIETEELPKATFRQLRTLRALSDGLLENRVYNDVCFHESVVAGGDAARDARGFLASEVFALYGDKEFIAGCCQGCPANAQHHEGWAGCYGWLPADLNWKIQLQAQHQEPHEQLVEWVDSALCDFKDEFDEHFSGLPTNWYGIWMPKILCFQQVRLLRKLFQRIERSKQQREFSNADNQALEQLVNALKLCEKHNLNMHVELLPAGNSDGNRWEMFAHCDNCKCVRTDASTGRCPGCNTTQQPCSARFQKVLGFRPYLRLKHVLGESNTVELVTSYLNHNK